MINKEEIEKEIARSVKSLKAAKKLMKEKLFEDAISRAYYAILHAAKAVLLVENTRINSHEAVKRLFGLHLVKAGKIKAQYARILREEQDERFLADYDVAFSPEIERVQKRVKDAEVFLKGMLTYLKQRGIKIAGSAV